MKFNLAIDGPSAAGKSTIANSLASKYHLIHLDTGAMYRAVAYQAALLSLDPSDEEAMADIAKNLPLEMTADGRVLLDQIDISDKIRNETISWMASVLSKHKKVRECLVALQQKIAGKGGYVLDGRDIGTVVLPDAELKIFLTASSKARTRRRLLEYQAKGLKVSEEEIAADIIKRDQQDSTRANSPLKPAADAIIIDTSDMSIEEVIAKISSYIDERFVKDHD